MAVIKVGDGARAPSTKASLLLDFANARSITSEVKFARSSTATQWSKDETVLMEENRFAGSTDMLNATIWDWSRHVPSDGVAGPYGNNDAIQFTQNAGDTNSGYWGHLSWAFAPGTFTFSIWAKAGSASYIRFDERQGTSKTTYFNLTNGTVSSSSSTNHTGYIEDAGNGWYRCSVTVINAVAGTTQLLWYFTDADYGIGTPYCAAGTVTGYLWGPQYVENKTLTDYVPTTFPVVKFKRKLVTVPADVPRFDIDPKTGESLGLRIEEARTNIIEHSAFQGISQGFVGSNGGTWIQNYGLAPDGTQSALLLKHGASSNAAYWYYTALPLSASTNYTYSVYVKKLPYSKVNGVAINMHVNSFGLSYWIYANLDTGQITQADQHASTNYSIQDVGDGWYRLSVTAQSIGTGYFDIGLYGKYYSTPTAADYVYDVPHSHAFMVWGSQLEVGSIPTSYIPTNGASATRSNESVIINDVQRFFSGSAGFSVAYKRKTDPNIRQNSYVGQLAGGDSGFILFRSATTSGPAAGAAIRDAALYNGSVNNNTTSGIDTTALSFSQDFLRGANDGIAMTEDTSVWYENNWSTLYLGGTGASAERLNGTLSHFAIYPEALSQEELIELSEDE